MRETWERETALAIDALSRIMLYVSYLRCTVTPTSTWCCTTMQS
jgi:hypothetical protein